MMWQTSQIGGLLLLLQKRNTPDSIKNPMRNCFISYSNYRRLIKKYLLWYRWLLPCIFHNITILKAVSVVITPPHILKCWRKSVQLKITGTKTRSVRCPVNSNFANIFTALFMCFTELVVNTRDMLKDICWILVCDMLSYCGAGCLTTLTDCHVSIIKKSVTCYVFEI